MTQQVNELELPATATVAGGFEVDPSYVDSSAVVMKPADAAPETSITIGAVATPDIDAANVTVYANNISSVGDAGETVAAFDIVFTVGINCGEGVSKTYQVVKRIGIDKLKIAKEVENQAPLSIVEAKAEVKAEEVKETKSLTEAKRFRVLAGLE